MIYLSNGDIMLSERVIQNKVAELLANTGMLGKAPVSLEKIAKYLGFSCQFFMPDTRTEDISGAVDHSKKKIYLNRQDSPVRMNFTLAHEIGHIILHGDDKNKNFIDYRRASTDPKEKEADSFAANLLMPESLFRHYWEKLHKNFGALADVFRVSKTAIGVRAYCLGLE